MPDETITDAILRTRLYRLTAVLKTLLFVTFQRGNDDEHPA